MDTSNTEGAQNLTEKFNPSCKTYVGKEKAIEESTKQNKVSNVQRLNKQNKSAVGYIIVSQSAPYGAPGLRERNLGAPRAIRLLIKILNWLILQLSKEAITALIKFIVGLRKLWSISSWAP